MKRITTLQEAYAAFFPHDDHHQGGPDKGAHGIIQFVIRDRNGNVLRRHFEPNIVKIFAKEMLAHRLPSSEVWDPQADSGTGNWIASGIDPTEEFAARYVLFGASFDTAGLPLDQDDSRFYVDDPVTGKKVPVRLGPGAEFDGGLINAIPFSEPDRSLKKVEVTSFQATFQPAGSPLQQDDVRGVRNIVQLQTTLRLDEYNGFGLTDADFFTITEVALAGGRKIGLVDQCDCTPRELFLEGAAGTATGTSPTSTGGTGGSLVPIPATANGGDVVTLDNSFTDVDLIKIGDQVRLAGRSDGPTEDSFGQVTPFYLVINKLPGGRDVQLDRDVVDGANDPITGSVGLFRDTLRIFSHRILSVPLKKSSDFEIDVIWSIIFN